MATAKMSRSLQKALIGSSQRITIRSFSCTPVCERLIRTFREKPKPEKPGPKYVPYEEKVEVRPRDDVYFIRDQDPPSHSFKEALDVLRAYAFYEETVRVNLRLNIDEGKVF